jgi:hypothetical protein
MIGQDPQRPLVGWHSEIGHSEGSTDSQGANKSVP